VLTSTSFAPTRDDIPHVSIILSKSCANNDYSGACHPPRRHTSLLLEIRLDGGDSTVWVRVETIDVRDVEVIEMREAEAIDVCSVESVDRVYLYRVIVVRK